MNTKCGLIGIVQPNYHGSSFIEALHKLQHRGHESCGVSWVNNGNIITRKQLGLVKDTYKDLTLDIYAPLFCGHVRYSTSGNGTNKLEKAQPLSGYNVNIGHFVLCHNGNIPLQKNGNIPLQKNGCDKTDTQIILEMIENDDSANIMVLLRRILDTYDRAYNLLIMTTDAIYVVKDKNGTRPLCLGEDQFNKGYCVSSESVALPHNYTYIREVKCGELLKICATGISTLYLTPDPRPAHCLFEYIYFLNENTHIKDLPIYKYRYDCGVALAKQDIGFNIKDLIVVGAPLTGIASGKGYAEYYGLEYKQLLQKHSDVNRTFILDTHEKREQQSKRKYIIDDNVDINGSRILLTDDSLVRGITLKNIIRKFRDKQVAEIHVRIAAPPIYNPCYYGIDIPTKAELLANTVAIDDMSTFLGCDSLKYITIDAVKKPISTKSIFCSGCFDGNYGGTLPNTLLDW